MSVTTPPLRFTKMHGAGNDFVILDLRDGAAEPPPALCRRIADRRTGIGCDQVIAMVPPVSTQALAGYRVWNGDGGAAGQCGNGARCVAAWLLRAGAAPGPRFRLDGPGATVGVELLDDGRIRLAMGRPRMSPGEIPLRATPESGAAGTAEYRIDIEGSPLRFAALSLGNPHAVVEVGDVAAAEVARIGAALQARPEFPDGVNVGFAQVLASDRIALRVYERGAGETLACGSGACAAVVALAARGRVGRRGVEVVLPGGVLGVDWPADDAEVMMSGPAEFVFEGEWLQ